VFSGHTGFLLKYRTVNKTKVLVLMSPESDSAARYRKAVESRPSLRDRVQLVFAKSSEALGVIEGAEVVVCAKLPPELLPAAGRLRWISFWSAGLDKAITPEMEERHLLLTNASGVHGPNIAEQVLAWMLMFSRRMPELYGAQLARVWKSAREVPPDELTGRTLGIAGFGRIGEALAVRARAFDMRIVASKRDTTRRYDASVAPDALYSADQLPEMLAESDHVCVAIPLTANTHHLFDKDLIAHMKPGAYFYNVSRGKLVDETALIAALREGRLAGAGLDVFETEPLPADSPLWGMDNVIITPHVAGLTPYYFTRAAALFADNMERYLAGEPLENLYDAKRGY
jgi:D-2-hydroxyacid dehydrogenase (NADP+)